MFFVSTDDIRYPTHGSESDARLRQRKRLWFDIDTSIFLALLASVSNCLTDGDHVHNFLLLIMLVMYMHQLLEGLSFCNAFSRTL
jgi:hypothetical protein